ncbi:MAG: insulinase family protein [Labilithrix sp.]|nr:insulinase family protein [Labilithrix sp.]
MKALPIALASATALLVAACGGEEGSRPPPNPPRPVAIGDAGATGLDPLGAKPEPGEPAAYTPPVPAHYKRPSGMEVWLLERHGLPIVSMQLVVPAGAAHDPEDKGGLAVTTANMLDEGAGKRGPLELSREIDRLGASLRTGAYADYGYAQLTVLKKNLAPAAELFGDVVSKPQLSALEYKRVHDLWQNALRARQSEPDAVASVVVARKVHPAGHPYAHPSDGTLASAAKVTLADVKKFYADRWRPDRATLVVVGDVTRAELDAVLDQALASWKAPAAPKPAETVGPPAPFVGRPGAAPPTSRRVFVVDRADAPQSVIAVARPGVSAFDEESAALTRVNAALGGSFTSRLNQDLREEHGWSYGARSRFSFTRMRGAFVAQAAVHTEHTGDALQAMLADIGEMAKSGLTDEEVAKTRQLARADLVESFETVQAAAARLGRNAGVGRAPDHEAAASHVTMRADKAELKRLAAQYLDLDAATIVIVGPRAKIKPQLEAIGITAIESSGPEGQ